jgi:hypothetical protein
LRSANVASFAALLQHDADAAAELPVFCLKHG